jgi:hypothetical protein
MIKRVCRKCNEYIPFKITINGKKCSLQNRKYCIKCSPYKNHNTKKDIDKETEKRDKYRNFSQKRKDYIKRNLQERGTKRKIELIKMSGGECSICGYKKNYKALTFHHLDRNTKLFGLSINHLWGKKWKDILEEWHKCILVCMNCHAEIEDEYSKKIL